MALTLHQKFDGGATTLAEAALVGPTLTCTRALNTARQRNSSGLIEVVNANIGRIDHDETGSPLGLLIEPTSENIALWSSDWTNAVYSATNITPLKDATGPDGVANSASTLTATANNGVISQAITVASGERTTSVWMRRKTGTGTVELTDNGFTNTTDVTADLSSTYWRQVGELTRTQANPVVGVRLGTSGDEVEVAYLQVEAYGFSTSPIETTTVPVTRNNDFIFTTNVSWVNLAAHSVYFRALHTTDGERATGYIYMMGGDFADYHYTRNGNNTNTPFTLESGNVVQVNENFGTLAVDVAHRYAIGLQANDLAAYKNGVQPFTASAFAMPTVCTKLILGCRTAGDSNSNMVGYIKEFRYYDERLTNSELSAMSNGEFPGEGGALKRRTNLIHQLRHH